jgi:hypothetical protein
MPSCSYCGRYILFGGVKTEAQRYCNDVCHTNELLRDAAMSVPDSTLEERVESALEARVEAVHSGECPQCGGMGPVDVHRAHTVYSFISVTKWQSVPIVSCRGCATRQQYRSILKSALLGWWGVPYGLLLTPLQIGRNIVGLMGGPEAAIPSEQLRSVVRHMIAAELQAASAEAAADRRG